MQNLDWYHSLNHPPLTPPDWIFAPVWAILYIMILVSFILFLKSKSQQDKFVPSIIWTFQLLINLLWTPMFFFYQNITFALVLCLILVILVFLTIISFYRFSKFAAILLIPYFLWVSFALYLNIAIWKLN